jgi:hypothetical protein
VASRDDSDWRKPGREGAFQDFEGRDTLKPV